MNFIIRKEQRNDYESTENTIKTAFASAEQSDQNEHILVSKIRKCDAFIPELSLIATNENNKDIIGQILLSKIFINTSDNQKLISLALAPISVLPDYQNKGIGKALIKKALEKAEEFGYQSIIVLGHPQYYPKFGFQKTSLWQIKAPFEVPEEALMAIELQPGSLNDISGIIEYPSVFFE